MENMVNSHFQSQVQFKKRVLPWSPSTGMLLERPTCEIMELWMELSPELPGHGLEDLK